MNVTLLSVLNQPKLELTGETNLRSYEAYQFDQLSSSMAGLFILNFVQQKSGGKKMKM